MQSAVREEGWDRRWDAAAAALAALATGLRCLTWPRIFGADGVVPLGVDPYYHLRRAALLAENLPASPQVDAYLSFPDGAPIPWPPGFDLLVALPLLLGADGDAAAVWGSLLVAVLGGLAVYLGFRLGARVFGPATGLLAAALLAVMPGAIQTSLAGRVDHHALVAPVSLGMLLAFLAATRASTPRRAVAFGIACGALAAAGVGSWIITPPLYFLPIPAAVIAMALRGDGAELRVAASASLVSAALGVLIVVLVVADLSARPFALYQPSLFSVSLFAAAAVAGVTAIARPHWLLPLLTIATVVAGALLVGAPSLRAPLVDALSVASGDDASYLTAWESYPLLYHGDTFTLARAANQYGALIWGMPLLAAGHAVGVWRKRRGDAAETLFAAFALWGTALLFFQQRFGEYAAPAVALLSAWALVGAARRIGAIAGEYKVPARIWQGGVVCLALALCAPLARGLHGLAGDDPVAHQRGLLAFSRDLERAIGPASVDGAPQHGVLTSWMDAHPLLFASGLPIAASSFATPEARAGNERAFRLLLASDDAAAHRGMRASRLRYVVVSPILESVEAMAAIAGFGEAFVQREIAVDAAGRPYEQYRPLLPFAMSLHTRLLLADGSEIDIRGFRSPATAHFRLLLESDVPAELFGGRVPRYKAFESVPGARIAGTGAPLQPVRIELDVESNIGRRFLYAQNGAADADGRFEFTVPYATDRADAPTRALGAYRLLIGDGIREVRVPESSIQGAGRISASDGASPKTVASAPAPPG